MNNLGTAAGQALGSGILAGPALKLELLLVLAAVALVTGYVHYRRSGTGRRRAHAKPRRSQARAQDHSQPPRRLAAAPPWPAAIPSRPAAVPHRPAVPGAHRSAAAPPWPAAVPSRPAAQSPWPPASSVPSEPAAGPPRATAGQPRVVDDYPSWPGRPGPYALHPDHPSWPGRPDPRWAATESALRDDGFPSRPEPYSPPSREAAPPEDGYPRWPEPYSPPGGEAQPPTYGSHRRPGGGHGPAGRGNLSPAGRHASPRPAGPAVPVPPARRIPPVSGPLPAAGPRADLTPHSAAVHQASPTGVIDAVRPEADLLPPEDGPLWDAGSAELASWIISDANQQAAEIRDSALDQVSTSLAGAKQEAAELVRQASEQAAAALAAAEAQAAEIRFYQYSACSLFLLVLRLPPVKRWIAARQKEGRTWLVYAIVAPVFALFVLAFTFILNEEIFKGIDSFTEHPSAE